MKKLMTIILAIVLIAGFTSTSKAQISIGAKVGLALPMGTFGDGFGMGFGGSAIGEYALNENMAIGLNLGFYSFGEKNSSGVTYSVIPILVDYKYFFQTKGFMPYVGAGLGMFLGSVHYASASVSGSDFGFSPKVGFWMGEGFKYGACIDYNIVSNSNHLGINVGFIYPLGK